MLNVYIKLASNVLRNLIGEMLDSKWFVNFFSHVFNFEEVCCIKVFWFPFGDCNCSDCFLSGGLIFLSG